ncbi:MAG: 50S ribosomal protein L11 methyltransferase [Bacteroidia bacterium]|nr:50S ribosomal protein L11 methyltransferase [Bacteroidia bacterium]
MERLNGYDVVAEEIKAGKHKLNMLIPSDPDAILDNFVTVRGEEREIPYWAELWHSAIALSEVLQANPTIVNGKKVLEIGCGLGLPGIVAGKLGARKVIFSDLLPEPLLFARVNWERNNLGDAVFQPADWMRQEELPVADVILASDVAYERRFFPSFFHLLRSVLPQSTVILSEPGRELAGDLHSALEKMDMNRIIKVIPVVRKGLKINVSVIILSSTPILAGS